MWFLLLSVIIVTAVKVEPNNIRDHALAQPKTDFSAFKDRHFEGSGGDDSKSVEVKKPEYNHHEFSFNHKQFHHRESGGPGFGLLGVIGNLGYHGNDDFGSRFNSQDFNRGSKHDSKDMESSFQHKTRIQSSNFGSETRGHEMSHAFDDTKINDKSIKSDHNSDSKFLHHNTNFKEYSIGDGSKEFQDRFGAHGFHRNLEHNFDDINYKFRQNSDIQKTIQQIQEFNKRISEEQNEKVQNEKDEFEILPVKNKRKVSDCHNQNSNKENFEIMNQNKQQNHNHHHSSSDIIEKDNIKTTTPSHNVIIITERPHNDDDTDQNLKTTTTKYINTEELQNNKGRRYYDVQGDDRPRFKPTTENEVLPTKPISSDKRMSQDSEDRWIWSDGNETAMPKPTSRTVTMPGGIDDRNAFNGDKCPTGQKRIGTMCVDED